MHRLYTKRQNNPFTQAHKQGLEMPQEMH